MNHLAVYFLGFSVKWPKTLPYNVTSKKAEQVLTEVYILQSALVGSPVLAVFGSRN